MLKRYQTAGAALLLAAGTALVAQQNTGQPTTITVQSNLVVLDVVVTDAQGHVVPGLHADDFRVTQNGAPQRIRNFETWSDRPALPAAAPVDSFGDPDWGPAPRNIFVLDGLTTPYQESIYAAVMLKKYLQTQPPLLPTPTMLLAVNDFGYRTLSGYTRDRDKLIAKLDARPPSIAGQLAMGSVGDTLTAQCLTILQQIALSAAGVPAHKNIIWIGRGFPSLDPSTLNDGSQASLAKAIRSTTTLLLDARVAVYKVDPMQTTTSTTEVDMAASLDIGANAADQQAPSEDPFSDDFNLNLFSVQTGGQYFYGLNSLDKYMGQSVSEGGQFYTLTYAPPQLSSDAYQTITVTTTRPGLTARTRAGYYAPGAPEPEPTSKELGFALGQAATGGMEFSGVSTHVTTVTPGQAPGTADVTFTIENRTLTWKPRAEGGELADVTAVLVALDARHQVVSSAAYKLHPYLKAKDDAKRTTGHLTVRDAVAVGAKTTSLRVLTRDASGRLGTADVPPAQLQELLAGLKHERVR